MYFKRIVLPGVSVAVSALFFLCAPGLVSGQEKNKGFSIGARYHTDHSVYSDLPFGKGDISYMAALEYAERLALWQLGVDFAPDVSGTRQFDPDDEDHEQAGTRWVVTPQLNLIFKDRMFRGGAGILTSYIRSKDGEGEWIGPYWQLLLGLSFNLTDSISLDTNAYYVLKDWGKITDFRFGDLDYSMLLTFRF